MTEKITKEIMVEIYAHAQECFPLECCGLIAKILGRVVYRPCENWIREKDGFDICPDDWDKVEEEGEILYVVHSHCNRRPDPTDEDRVGCETTQLPWLIVSWPTKHFRIIKPSGFQLPFLGRNFSYGQCDCISLVRDYYLIELGITLPKFKRTRYGWWNEGDDFLMDNFTAYGFERIGVPEKHCVFLIQVKSDVANHSAIYLGDGMILHHLESQVSRKAPYGGYWEKNTRAIVRYKDLK